jgi:hypothetical protein
LLTISAVFYLLFLKEKGLTETHDRFLVANIDCVNDSERSFRQREILSGEFDK